MKLIRSSTIGSSSLSLLLVVATQIIQQQQRYGIIVNAYSSGTGSCNGGTAAVGGPHLSTTPISNGTLKDYGMTLSFNDFELTPTYPRNQFYTDFESNVEFAVSLKAPQNNMKGCFIRFSTESSSPKTVFLLEPVNNTKLADACASIPDAIGITHTSSDEKMICSGTISVTYNGKLFIDTTVVIGLGTSGSTYAYDRFELRSAVTLPPETSSPAASIAPTTRIGSSPTTTSTTTAPAPVLIIDRLQSDTPSFNPTSTSDSPSSTPSTASGTPSMTIVVNDMPIMPNYRPTLLPTESILPPKPATVPTTADISSATKIYIGILSLIIGLLSTSCAM